MSITEKLAVLLGIYQQIDAANKRFLEQSSSFEVLSNMIDQRALALEDLPVLAEALTAAIKKEHPEQDANFSSITEIVLAVKTLEPSLNNSCEQIREALAALIDSDKLVEQKIGQLQTEIKAEVGRLRQGSRGIRGYRQNQNFGSCFINKIK